MSRKTTFVVLLIDYSSSHCTRTTRPECKFFIKVFSYVSVVADAVGPTRCHN